MSIIFIFISIFFSYVIIKILLKVKIKNLIKFKNTIFYYNYYETLSANSDHSVCCSYQ
jgi:hypothetical protein